MPRPMLHSLLLRFRRDDRGSILILSLFLFVAMVFYGGVAVDVARHETLRTKMQNCMDRAVLAATDLSQTLPPTDVVMDYAAKCGLPIDEDDIDVVQTGIYPLVVSRTVTVNATVPMRTMFMNFMGTTGIDTLDAAASSQANEAATDLEISLVLDISGSMARPASDGEGGRSTTRIAAMQNAADSFIDQIFATARSERMSMSIVPYATQVNAGETLLAQFLVDRIHDYSNCVNFPGASFGTTALPLAGGRMVAGGGGGLGTPLEQTGHFDPFSRYYVNTNGNGGDGTINWRDFRDLEMPVCRIDTGSRITPWSQNVAALKAQVARLTPNGNTSIDVAVKWGAALLDPQTRPALSNLIDAGEVDTAFRGRPFDYDREKTHKILVVMTDGQNTDQAYLADRYRDGPSDTWYDPDTDRFIVDAPETGSGDGDGVYETWYVPDEQWRYNDENGMEVARLWWDRILPWAENDDRARHLTWPELFAMTRLSYRAYWHHYAQYWDAGDYYDSYYGPPSWNGPLMWVRAAEKNNRLIAACDALKAKNEPVTVFTIGFEVSDDSAAIMRNCASTDNHFYRVNGTDISYAFASIANEINDLKLTK